MPATVLPPDLARQLRQARERVARRRVEAFVAYRPRLCGFDLEPITLRSYSRLIAFESPFVYGGPIDFEAIAVFVWVHHPKFSTDASRRRSVVRKVWRALNPRFSNLNSVVRLASEIFRSSLLRKLTVRPAVERYREAADYIRHLVAMALDDLPRSTSSGEDAEGNEKTETEGSRVALPACIMGQLARDLHLSDDRVESLPLARAVQLYRESLEAAGSKGLGMMHPEEARVWSDYLAP